MAAPLHRLKQLVKRVHGVPALAKLWRATQDRLAATDAAKRDRVALDAVKAANPHVDPNARGELRRVAVLWESRLEWLGHANADKRVEIIRLPRSIVTPGWNYHMRAYLEASSSDPPLGEYAIDRYYRREFSDARRNFSRYCEKVLTTIRRQYEFDVVVMPKLNDDWTIDFINTAQSIGLSVLVDDREGAITPKRLAVVPAHLRQQLRVSFEHLFVHNDIHRDLFVQSGLPSDKITINGAPQSDYWHHPEHWKSRQEVHPALRDDRFTILFFSFGPRSYLNFYYGNETRDWSGLGEDFHEVLLELLRRHGDRIQIVHKSGGKPLRDLFPGYERFIERAKPYMNEDNYVVLDARHNSFDLMRTANVVLGFQTSGMVEAMFTDVPIVYGGWGPFFDEIQDTLLPLHRCEGLTYCRSPDEMLGALDKLISERSRPLLSPREKVARAELRERYFAKADGHVSRRLLEAAATLADEKYAARQGIGTAALRGESE